MPAPDYTYEIVFVGPIVNNKDGEYYEPILDNGTYPLDAQNPKHPDGLTLREILELPDGTVACGHSDGFGNQNFIFHGGVIYSYMSNPTATPLKFLAISATSQNGVDVYYGADQMGIINYPDGTWEEVTYVTSGSC